MLVPWNGDPGVASAVLTAGFADYPVPQSETPEDIARQVLDGYISADASWIAFHGPTAVGGIFGAARADRRARIHSMAVTSAHRRQGIGSQLLTAFLEGMNAAGISMVHLEVIETNAAARSVYEASGFEPVRALDCLRSPSDGTTATLPPSVGTGGTALTTSAVLGPPQTYAARDAPLHRDFAALTSMPSVVFRMLPSGCWSAHRGNVLLAAEDWADEGELRVLLASMSRRERMKIVDVPEGDRLGPALLHLGWSRYTRQIEMLRRA